MAALSTTVARTEGVGTAVAEPHLLEEGEHLAEVGPVVSDWGSGKKTWDL